MGVIMNKVIKSRSALIMLLLAQWPCTSHSIKLKDIISNNDNNMTAQYMFSFDSKVEVELEHNKKTDSAIEHVILTIPATISPSLQNSINYIHDNLKADDGFSVKITEKKQDKSFVCEISFDSALIDFKMSNGNSVSAPYALILNFYKKDIFNLMNTSANNNRLRFVVSNERSLGTFKKYSVIKNVDCECKNYNDRILAYL